MFDAKITNQDKDLNTVEESRKEFLLGAGIEIAIMNWYSLIFFVSNQAIRCSYVKGTHAFLDMLNAEEKGMFAEYYNCTADDREFGCMRLDSFSVDSKPLFDSLNEDGAELMLINYSGSDIGVKEAQYVLNELIGPMIPAETFVSSDKKMYILAFHSTDAKEVSMWNIPQYPESREVQYFMLRDTN